MYRGLKDAGSRLIKLWSIFIPKRLEERITVTVRQETETSTSYSFYWKGLKYKNDVYARAGQA